MNYAIASKIYEGLPEAISNFELPVTNIVDDEVFESMPRDFLCAFRPYNTFYFKNNQRIKAIYTMTGPYKAPEHKSSSAWPVVIIRKFSDTELAQGLHLNGEVYPKMFVPQRPENKFAAKPIDQQKVYEKASADFHKIRAEVPLALKTQTQRENFEKRTRDGNKKMGSTKLRLSPHTSMQAVETPKEMYDNFNKFFKFDHDPCPIHSETNALETEWGRRNYVNPPFKHTDAFVMRAVELYKQNGACTVVLCPARTASRWFEWLFHSKCLNAVVFLRSGIKFEGFTGTIPHPMMLLCIGDKFGKCFERQPYVLFWDVLTSKKRRVTAVDETFLRYFDKLNWPC